MSLGSSNMPRTPWTSFPSSLTKLIRALCSMHYRLPQRSPITKTDKLRTRGDPHATPKNDDPLHASITLSKEGSRVTSAHVYPDGTVIFSKAIYGQVKLSRISEAPEGSGPAK